MANPWVSRRHSHGAPRLAGAAGGRVHKPGAIRDSRAGRGESISSAQHGGGVEATSGWLNSPGQGFGEPPARCSERRRVPQVTSSTFLPALPGSTRCGPWTRRNGVTERLSLLLPRMLGGTFVPLPGYITAEMGRTHRAQLRARPAWSALGHHCSPIPQPGTGEASPLSPSYGAKDKILRFIEILGMQFGFFLSCWNKLCHMHALHVGANNHIELLCQSRVTRGLTLRLGWSFSAHRSEAGPLERADTQHQTALLYGLEILILILILTLTHRCSRFINACHVLCLGRGAERCYRERRVTASAELVCPGEGSWPRGSCEHSV